MKVPSKKKSVKAVHVFHKPSAKKSKRGDASGFKIKAGVGKKKY